MLAIFVLTLLCPFGYTQNANKPVLQEISVPSKNLGENRTVKLNCNLLEGGQVDFEWFHNNAKIRPNDRRRIVNNQESSELVIKSLSVQDLGEYKCIGRNEYGEEEQRVSLLFNVKPKWLVEPQDQIAKIGQEIFLDCLVNSYPPPSVQWFKINGKEKKAVSSNSNKWKFDLNKKTAGIYKCLASNSLGSIEKSVKVSYYGKSVSREGMGRTGNECDAILE